MRNLNEKLADKLLSASVQQYEQVMNENESSFVNPDMAFTDYMRLLVKQKRMRWTDVAERCGLPVNYVYKLVSREKATRKMDIIIRLGFGMRLDLEEMQRVLVLYGFRTLYVRRRRDALLMKLFMEGTHDITAVNWFLSNHEETVLENRKSRSEGNS